ncbi:HOLLIDAY JUNCTION RESOLVASE [Salix viminalis]|uniref:HOLLIDAY JUNCTION RESOLVASE n=1 Tax=Salix viminalis TaxID=40686 RepID=A0A9Q0TLE9_SALVM|nr:HOLLIDAY JUNCTION RESOLVASE [Salix viminalis]
MERKSSSKELQNLLQAIKSSDVVESRIELFDKLRDFDLLEKSDLDPVIECLTVSSILHLDAYCLLNKSILSVATKYVDSGLSGCLVQFLVLGTKASGWCGKHLKMTAMSTEGSQEEHSNLFFQLLLDLLSLSSASVVALTRHPVFIDNASAAIVERFILEQLNLIKDIVSEIKSVSSFGSELLKAAQTVIDTVMGLCKRYFDAVNWDLCDARLEKDENNIDSERANIMNHVTNITKRTAEKLCELGILAGNDGGNLVIILNVSWKGVVTLLQQGKRVSKEMSSVQNIIVTLISLVNKPLRCAAEAWSSSLKETISLTEARRAFLPSKFYLTTVVKISSLYPCQAYLVYKEVTLCVLAISTFKILLSHEKLLNTASEVLSELLEKTSIDLLNSLLNSTELKQEHKFELLDWLFSDESCSNSMHEGSSIFYRMTSMVEIFSVSCETMSEARLLLLGRVALFHNLLRNSMVLEEDIRIKITRKFRWFLDMLVHEDVYSFVLDLQIPVPYGSGKALELVWQPMFSSLLHALKTFMIVVSSSFAWEELEALLLENLFHPHFLCWEIVMELWCFMARYAEMDKVNSVIDKLCSLMKLLESPESFLIPGSPMRKVARIICLLANGTTPLADRVYSSVVGDGRSQLSSVMFVALLLEGFSLNSLCDSIRSNAKEKIITDYFGFIGSFNDKMLTTCSSGAIGIPVHALSASLRAQQVCISDVDMKTLKFLVAIIRNFRNPGEKIRKEHYHKLLSETLGIVSHMKHLYKSDEMEGVILELQTLFVSAPAASSTQLYQCKPYLALFMGGLGDMEMIESDDCAKSSAVWELYHMLFRERHWALVHLAIKAFGYFAARTTCNQLWRFVPQNASLSYDLMSGTEASEERFMSELKAFLEKETALLTTTPSMEQLELLVTEGMTLKEMVQQISRIHVNVTEFGSIASKKRRKLPDGISRGVELLQSGLKLIGGGISQWQENHSESYELHDKFLSHLSCLEDVVAHLTGLAGNG